MNSIVLVVISALVLIIAYQFYGRLMANKVLELDKNKKVPSEIFNDGSDYVPTNKVVLFGRKALPYL